MIWRRRFKPMVAICREACLRPTRLKDTSPGSFQLIKYKNSSDLKRRWKLMDSSRVMGSISITRNKIWKKTQPPAAVLAPNSRQMIVISDTSPLNYLILIECIDVLPELYGRVVIPEGVLAELQRDNTPQVVKKWIAMRPDWLDIRQARMQPDERLAMLGVGERQANSLAQEL